MIKIWREKREITKSHKHSTVSFITLFKMHMQLPINFFLIFFNFILFEDFTLIARLLNKAKRKFQSIYYKRYCSYHGIV